jgi:hypothetical protein
LLHLLKIQAEQVLFKRVSKNISLYLLLWRFAMQNIDGVVFKLHLGFCCSSRLWRKLYVALLEPVFFMSACRPLRISLGKVDFLESSNQQQKLPSQPFDDCFIKTKRKAASWLRAR